MATILFYEKPGCAGNAHQKALLSRAGHELVVRDLLSEPWSVDRLLEVFAGMPVSEWFNLSAPRVKSGDVDPGSLSPQQAAALMIREPLLIRRPIMESDGEIRVGFETAEVDAWVGLVETDRSEGNLDGCPKEMKGSVCESPV